MNTHETNLEISCENAMYVGCEQIFEMLLLFSYALNRARGFGMKSGFIMTKEFSETFLGIVAQVVAFK